MHSSVSPAILPFCWEGRIVDCALVVLSFWIFQVTTNLKPILAVSLYIDLLVQYNAAWCSLALYSCRVSCITGHICLQIVVFSARLALGSEGAGLFGRLLGTDQAVLADESREEALQDCKAPLTIVRVGKMLDTPGGGADLHLVQVCKSAENFLTCANPHSVTVSPFPLLLEIRST